MKSLYAALALALILTISPIRALAQEQAPESNLAITVYGLRNDKGVVRLALFGDKPTYKADEDNSGEEAVRRRVIEIKNGVAHCDFAQLPYGTYAVKFYHDENNSGNFETGMFGIPKVEYGFSNNARANFGPPSFEKASFKVSQAQMTLNLVPQQRNLLGMSEDNI